MRNTLPENRKDRLRKLAFQRELGYTNASLDIMEANAYAFGIECACTSGDILPHMGTTSTAHDMAYVAKKLGLSKIRYMYVR
jgi:hypothetical protein